MAEDKEDRLNVPNSVQEIYYSSIANTLEFSNPSGQRRPSRSSWSYRRPSIVSQISTTDFIKPLVCDILQPSFSVATWSSTTEHTPSNHVADIDLVKKTKERTDWSSTIPCETTALLHDSSATVGELLISRSSFAHTVFNTVNLIFGVGLLSLPLAIRYAGLLLGLTMFIWSAVVTIWTTRMMERCLNHNKTIRSFGDLAFTAYGSGAEVIVTILMVIELTAASMSQIVLFADGAKVLFPGTRDMIWKIVCGATFIPLSWAPLRYLGVSSALGVSCFFTIATSTVVVGFARSATPGSLHSHANLTVVPQVWSTLPSSIGMILATWGGHTVFPELYHDMARPQDFYKSVKASYAICFPILLLVGLSGYIMFGNNTTGPITSELLALKDMPVFVSVTIMVLVTLFPIAKVPLNIYPLAKAIERAINFQPTKSFSSSSSSETRTITNTLIRSSIKPGIRTSLGIAFVALSILFPRLDQIMSVLGVIAGLLIAVILPICFYLTIMTHQVSTTERIMCILAILFSGFLATVSLYSTFVLG